MSLTNSSLPIQTVSNTSSQYYVAVQAITRGQSNKETVSTSLKWANNSFTINDSQVRVQVPSTSNTASVFTASGTKPLSANPDDTWYDTTTDITFRYIDDGSGKFKWVDVSSVSNFGSRIPGPDPVTVNYLIVGGGGGGGFSGTVAGGGGGGGGVLIGCVTLNFGQVYPVVVGVGGRSQGTTPSCAYEPKGNNSTALGFTAFGGGRGGWGCQAAGLPGASGGGGGSYNGGKTGGLALCSPAVGIAGIQGYPGGTGTCAPGLPAPPAARAGGGGGAGGAGVPGGQAGITGQGGIGRLWPFTNSYYGGGGGGSFGAGGGGFSGGLGGGGPGCSAANNMGQFATGGGGGGQSGSPKNLGGGPGIVGIAVPTDQYLNTKIIIPAAQFSAGNVVATTPPAAPGYTVLLWSSNGSFQVSAT